MQNALVSISKLTEYLFLGTLGRLLVTGQCAKRCKYTGFGVRWTLAENSASALKRAITLWGERLHAKSNDQC